MANLELRQLIPLPAPQIPDQWPLVRDLVDEACKMSGGGYSVADILRFVLQGKMQLWMTQKNDAVQAVAITQVIDYPQFKVCHFMAVQGEGMKEWTHLLEEIEIWARQNNCHKMLIAGRAGWERVLKDYSKIQIVLEKTLGKVH